MLHMHAHRRFRLDMCPSLALGLAPMVCTSHTDWCLAASALQPLSPSSTPCHLPNPRNPSHLQATDRALDAKNFAALDVSFRHHSKMAFTTLGAAFYDERRERAWASSRPIGQGGMFEMWMGKKHSITLTATGPMLQIDRACTVRST